MFKQLLQIVHVLAASGLIGMVLIQHGKGADAGAAFGSGASSTVFGSRGSGSVMTRITTGLAVVFFCTSLGLAMLSRQYSAPASVMDSVVPAAGPAVEEVMEMDSMPAVDEGMADVPTPPQDDVPTP